MIIQSSLMGSLFGATFDAGLESHAYEVFLNEDGKLRWRGMEDGQEVIYKKEPQSTWRERFIAGIMRLLPIRGQL